MEAISAKLRQSEYLEPEVRSEDAKAVQLVQRIRKLRWIGMDEEAERLKAELRDNVRQADILISDPAETD